VRPAKGDEVQLETLQLLGVGALAGGLGALLGVGGGVILVPGLIFLAGLPFQSAVATSLVCVVATSVAGSAVYLRRGAIDLPIAVELQAFTVLGAVAAGLSAAFVPVAPLYLSFAALLAVIAFRTWPRREGKMTREPHGASKRMAAGASVGAGLVSGLLGVGGGVLNVPILHSMLGLAFDRAVATSVFMIGVTAASAAAVYLIRGAVDVPIAAVTMLGTVAGASIAARAGRRIGQRSLKMGFSLLLAYVAYRMILRGIAQF
jgi:uncharacterized membrane protein YfcA